MKYWIYTIAAIWLFSFIQLIPSLLDYYKSYATYEGPVVRVVANSQKAEDQYQKMEFVNYYFQGDDIEDEQLIAKYPITQVSGAKIPPKWINGKFYPQQQLPSAQIVIGDGRGDNWFCAMFYYACGYDSKKEVKKQKNRTTRWIKNKIIHKF